MSLLKDINNGPDRLDEVSVDGLKDVVKSVVKIGGAATGLAQKATVKAAKGVSSLAKVFADTHKSVASSGSAVDNTDTDGDAEQTSGQIQSDENDNGAITQIFTSVLSAKPTIVALCTFDEAKALVLGKGPSIMVDASPVTEAISKLIRSIISEDDTPVDAIAPKAKVKTHEVFKVLNPKISFLVFPAGFIARDVQAAVKADRSIKKICVFHVTHAPKTLDEIIPLLDKKHYTVTLQALGFERMITKLGGPKAFSLSHFNSDPDSIFSAFDITLRNGDKDCVIAHYKDKTVLLTAAEEWERSDHAENKSHAQAVKKVSTDKTKSDELHSASTGVNNKDEIVKIFLDATSKADGAIKPDFIKSLISNNRELSKYGLDSIKSALTAIKKSLNADLRKQIDTL